MLATPECFAHLTQLLQVLAGGRVCAVLEVTAARGRAPRPEAGMPLEVAAARGGAPAWGKLRGLPALQARPPPVRGSRPPVIRTWGRSLGTAGSRRDTWKVLHAFPVLEPVRSKAHRHLAESATRADQHLWERTGVRGKGLLSHLGGRQTLPGRCHSE